MNVWYTELEIYDEMKVGDIGGRTVYKKHLLWQNRKNASRKEERGREKQNVIMDCYINIEERGSQRMPFETNKPGTKRLNMKEIQEKIFHEFGLDKVFLHTKSIIQK